MSDAKFIVRRVRHIQWSGMTWFRVVNAQLVEDWELYDRLDFNRKLGLGRSRATKRRGHDMSPYQTNPSSAAS